MYIFDFSLYFLHQFSGMFKTRKNNLTMEDGHKLRNMIAGLSGPQQMTVIEILRENKEHLAQDDEGNVEMEFREFNQKSIDDLKSYVLSVTTSNQKSSLGKEFCKGRIFLEKYWYYFHCPKNVLCSILSFVF